MAHQSVRNNDIDFLNSKHPDINRVKLLCLCPVFMFFSVQCSEECTDLFIGGTKQPLHALPNTGDNSSGQDSAVHLHLKDKGHSFEDSTIYCSLFLFCSSSTWCCLHCLKVNSLQDVLCEECELPRMDSLNTKADESQPKPGLSDTVVILHSCFFSAFSP